MRREDLEFFVANLPDTSPMHKLLADWLVKDVMDPNLGDEMDTNRGTRQIDEFLLERLPDSFVRFLLNHLLNSKISGLKNLPLKAKRKYMRIRQRERNSES
ncbi:hypothetical protein N8I77_006380 [Diaporthe amygdali]|uniref:Uncharacterized protein n=1 Tax=Phomopsis amygdali TaxID=1214568 RepID=A0AAD9W4F2_PHOAM|nr:hypothetical protein N8I77_006380 [Diaporthe amygdali]